MPALVKKSAETHDDRDYRLKLERKIGAQVLDALKQYAGQSKDIRVCPVLTEKDGMWNLILKRDRCPR